MLLVVFCRNKPQPVYVADMVAEEYGHEVLHLLPFHHTLNPTEYIWDITKNYYRDHDLMVVLLKNR